MLRFITFASGILAGIVGVKLLKNSKTQESLDTIGGKARAGLDKAQAGLRDATVSSLSAIEKSSAHLRAKLAPDTPAEAAAEATAVPVAKSSPRRKVASKPKAAAPSPVEAKPESES